MGKYEVKKQWRGYYPKGNQYARKISVKKIKAICEDAREFVEDNPGVWFFKEVQLYLAKKYSLKYFQVDNLFAKRKNSPKNPKVRELVLRTKKNIMDILEVRMLKNDEVRVNVQNLVLSTRYRYGERKSIDNLHEFKEMPSIKINGKDKKIEVGGEENFEE